MNLIQYTVGSHPALYITILYITRLAAASDKVYQLLAHGWWFSSGTPTSSTTTTGHHHIAERLLKVVLSTINQIKSLKFIGKVLSLSDFIELSPFVNMIFINSLHGKIYQL